MDFMSHMWQQDSWQIEKRYDIEKLSYLLPKMQTRNHNQRKGFTDNCHQRARRFRRRADELVR